MQSLQSTWGICFGPTKRDALPCGRSVQKWKCSVSFSCYSSLMVAFGSILCLQISAQGLRGDLSLLVYFVVVDICNESTLPRGACANGSLRCLFRNCSGQAGGALAPAADTCCQHILYAVHCTSSEVRLAWCTCCSVLLGVARCCNTRHLFRVTSLSPAPLHFIPRCCASERASSEE